VQHRTLSELQSLLCGRAPEIYSARDRPRRAPVFVMPPAEPQSARNPRFSRVSPDWVPGQVPHFRRPDTTATALTKQARLISEVRQAEEYTQSMSNTLQAYRNSHQIKAIVHEKDFEDHFYVPLQRRIRNKMVGDNYKQYLVKKDRLIRNMDAHPVPIRSHRQLPPVPRIEVQETGLHDPKNRYVEHQAIEERLDRVINRANGVVGPEKRTPGTKTLDYKLFSVLGQTKFFFGNDTQQPIHAGVKCFPGSGASRVGKMMDLFE
jgi:hypothetical protein